MSKNDTGVYLAVDLGASSGRVMAGLWDGQALGLTEVHRFHTPSLQIGAYWYWDILNLYSSILDGLRMAAQLYGDSIVSIGVDTWGVDYGLLDARGELMANPICYRDGRTEGLIEELQDSLGASAIYAETGVQSMPFNTLYQLAAERREGRGAFASAQSMLFLPDLLNYWLSGNKATERTIASTSQLLNPVTGDWSKPLLERLRLERAFLGDIVEPGTKLGKVSDVTQRRTGLNEVEVVSVPGHDTACAFMALAVDDPSYAILSSGTWSLMGLELHQPDCSERAMQAGFTNEIGFGGTVRFLKIICGLWLLEESRRQWQSEGHEVPYEEIVRLAGDAEPLASLFDPDDARFAGPGDMPARIAEYCRESGQPAPQGVGAVARAIFDSLAMKYRYVFSRLGEFSPTPLQGLQVLGGGSRNAMLNQMAADAIGLPVVAGPAEATAIGNVAAQLIASGAVSDLAVVREKIGSSFPAQTFQPINPGPYAKAEDRFARLVENGIAPAERLAQASKAR